MIRALHPVAGGLSMLLIGAFWVATVASEVSGSNAAVYAVKTGILWSLCAMVPLLALTGISGFRLGRNSTLPLIDAKRRRMPFIALNGLLILVPSAVFLQQRAAVGQYDTSFVVVQGVELVAGLANLILLALNMRDGFRVTRAN
jgi:hypothetical protein